MTEKSWPFAEAGPGDGMAYTDAEWQGMWNATFGIEGILKGFLNELVVTVAGANDLQIDTGACYVYGCFYQNITAHVHIAPTSAPAGETRKCAVIIAQNHTTQEVRVAFKVGSAGSYPAMTQTPGTLWEMLHYYYTINDAGAITGLTKMSAYAHFRTEITQGMLAAGILTANAAGRALMQTGYFDVASVLDKFATGSFTTANVLALFAAGSFTTANLLSLIPANAVTNAVLLQAVLDGAFQADANTRALFANGIWKNDKHAIGARFFKGMCLPFSGTFTGHFPNDVDSGAPDTSWHLCNGDTENGVTTPNLADKMVIAAGGTYAAGSSGGAATHTHTQGATGATALSNHTHLVAFATDEATWDAGAFTQVSLGFPENVMNIHHTHNITDATENPPSLPTHTHTNPTTAAGSTLPPYYSLAYICYVGTP
jgi:hypothetical protein